MQFGFLWGRLSAACFAYALFLLLPTNVIAGSVISDPLATLGTEVDGISGSLVVGTYYDALGSHGYTYNGTTYTTIPEPSDPFHQPNSTHIVGVSGSTIVGVYTAINRPVPFSFNGSTYTTFSVPGTTAGSTWVGGISQNLILGSNLNSPASWYTYDGSTFSLHASPFANTPEIRATGMSGNTTVGWYDQSPPGIDHGWVYDGSTYTTLDVPTAGDTVPYGISGGTIVGYYIDSTGTSTHGFLHTSSGFTTFDYPSANGYTIITSIDGNNIGGYYTDSSGVTNGFVSALPEPTFLGLLAVAGLIARRRRSLPS